MSDASMSGGVVPGCPVELDKVSWREAARCLRELTQLKREYVRDACNFSLLG